jgi:hypothetical protein
VQQQEWPLSRHQPHHIAVDAEEGERRVRELLPPQLLAAARVRGDEEEVEVVRGDQSVFAIFRPAARFLDNIRLISDQLGEKSG